jgi:hypothetical protein
VFLQIFCEFLVTLNLDDYKLITHVICLVSGNKDIDYRNYFIFALYFS